MTPPPAANPSAAATAVFTIVSRNYLHFALNLMASVAEQLPGTRRVIVLCDADDGVPPLPEGIELLPIGKLCIDRLDRMVVQYTILELNTAIKPSAFTTLMQREGVERVIYFDPDIQLYSSGAPLLQRLAEAEVVLTPHLTAPLADDRHPSDLSILQSGTYNLGFLALARSAQTLAFLRWWAAKLERDCVVDIPRGLFTDQKWIDLAPGLLDRVHVERDPGWNVAYWNLAHRRVEHVPEGWRVEGRPLFFFHFSGYTPGSRSISKHQDRFTLDNAGPAVRQLFADYDESVAAMGRERFAALPYAFAALADGTPLPDIARQVIRSQLDWHAPLPDLRSDEGARVLRRFLTEPVDGGQPPLSRLSLQMHRLREDLRHAFPDVTGVHRQAYAAWFAERAPIEAGVVPALAPAAGVTARAPSVASAEPTGTGATEPAAESSVDAAAPAMPAMPAMPATPPPPPPSAWPYRLAYRLAWQARGLLRPLSTPRFRQRARNFLVRRAFPPAPVVQAAPPAATAAGPLPWGVSVIGYVRAESGVGESARATLRALAASGVPHAVNDFREGNVSRMGEQVDAALESGQRHAVSLFHINADQLPMARVVLGEPWFGVPHRIGFWAWELENFPAEWHAAFDHLDEVWVPSSFCQRAIAQHAPVPVLTVPHTVVVPERLHPDRARFGLREGSVVFFALADVMSATERKNPFGAVQAFEAAFGGRGDDVELVVKVSNGERDPDAMARLRAMSARCPGVHLVDGYLHRHELNTLFDSADVLVSLHRSEGFGLVLAEAMARGKVVVATGWSGNMDFMGAHNALPVDYRLVAIERDIGPYKAGERWAEPSIEDAAAKLRRVAADAALRAQLGDRARADVLAQLAPPVVARQVGERLRVIRQRKRL